MPLTFAQAYAIVCPEGNPVVPKSKEFNDILELMRQSGYLAFQDTFVKENVPRVPKTEQEAKQYIERVVVAPTTTKVSKKQWLSVAANREAFMANLNKNKK